MTARLAQHRELVWYVCTRPSCNGRFLDPQSDYCSASCRELDGGGPAPFVPEAEDLTPFLPEDGE